MTSPVAESSGAGTIGSLAQGSLGSRNGSGLTLPAQPGTQQDPLLGSGALRVSLSKRIVASEGSAFVPVRPAASEGSPDDK
jgi:hypothetical protein